MSFDRNHTGVIWIWLTLLATGMARADAELSSLIDQMKPAVVTVLAYKSADSSLPSGRGTGFFVTPRKLVTNWHVIRGAKKLEFRDHKDNAIHVSAVAGISTKHDLAVLVASDDYKADAFLETSNSPPAMGTTIYALGSPLGLNYTLSDGVVSSTRELEGREVIQITAAISRGSSGSPIFRKNGRVIGVATFTLKGGQSLNFAIPIKHIERLLKAGPTPVEQATRAGNTQFSTDVLNGLEDELYELFARRYLQTMNEQRSARPELEFGRKNGSVGHLDDTVTVFQVLSKDSALVRVHRGHQAPILFKVDGVNLQNFTDGERTRFEKDLILVQFTTFRYVTVAGSSKTVYAVNAIDRDRFIAILRSHFFREDSRLKRLQDRRNEIFVQIRELSIELNKKLADDENIRRARKLKSEIAMYAGLTDKPRIRNIVDDLKAELAKLDVSDEDIDQYESSLEALRVNLKQRKKELASVSNAIAREKNLIPDSLR